MRTLVNLLMIICLPCFCLAGNYYVGPNSQFASIQAAINASLPDYNIVLEPVIHDNSTNDFPITIKHPLKIIGSSFEKGAAIVGNGKDRGVIVDPSFPSLVPDAHEIRFENIHWVDHNFALVNRYASYGLDISYEDCVFTFNNKLVFDPYSDQTVRGCIIKYNTGGYFFRGYDLIGLGRSSYAVLENCIIFGNDFSARSFVDFTEIMNCVVLDDLIIGRRAFLINSIIGGQATFGEDHSESNYTGPDPGFVDPANHNYRLAPGSPCINTGRSYRGMPVTDLDGNPRPDTITGLPDIGAYEYIPGFTPPPSPTPIFTLTPTPTPTPFMTDTPTPSPTATNTPTPVFAKRNLFAGYWDTRARAGATSTLNIVAYVEGATDIEARPPASPEPAYPLASFGPGGLFWSVLPLDLAAGSEARVLLELHGWDGQSLSRTWPYLVVD